MGYPNSLAFLVLLLWPVVALLAFRSLGPARGLIVTLVGAHLLLPTGLARFELPILPSLDKYTIPSFASLAIALLLYRSRLQIWPESRVARILILLFLVGPLLTALTNTDPIRWGSTLIPGMQLREVPSTVLSQISLLTPLLLGRSLLSREDGLRDLVWALVLGTLLYSPLMLLEVRLSPQLNIWIYGFFQHNFLQMMRGDGFRPIVFLDHGLWVGLLVSTAVLATCTLLRSANGTTSRLRLVLALIWLFAVLVACKSLGSLIYALLVAPLILLGSVRMQVRVAALLGLLAFLYPVARGMGVVPTDQMVRLASDIANADRAQSLEYRFDNEEVLLERAQERSLFGWGIWGRNQIYDTQTGRMLTVTDGRWIITMGSFGWVGFVSEFGLLLLPLLLIWRKRSAQTPLVAGQALMLAVIMVDQIPNATLNPLTLLYVGGLLGWAERPQLANMPLSSPKPAAVPVLIGRGPKEGDLRPVI